MAVAAKEHTRPPFGVFLVRRSRRIRGNGARELPALGDERHFARLSQMTRRAGKRDRQPILTAVVTLQLSPLLERGSGGSSLDAHVPIGNCSFLVIMTESAAVSRNQRTRLTYR